MRKILLIIIIILLGIFGYASVSKGIQIGSFTISSIMEIDETSKLLDQKTEEVNSLIDVKYPERRTELTEASNRMQDSKQRYLDETNLSTDDEIKNALQIESYDIERLWAKVGIHAQEEGVNIKLTLNSSSSGASNTKDLYFTVDGTYIGITNFVYSLEDDNELNFRIYNFELVPHENEILRASFVVRDIRITQESLNESLTSSSSNTTNNENKANTTNTTNTTNSTGENTQGNTTTQNTAQ